MFDVIDTSTKRVYCVLTLAKTIGCKPTDFNRITHFVSAWERAFHPDTLEYWNYSTHTPQRAYSTTE